jgi:5'-nucleotidase/UDP-sugar diphosphatase
VLGFVDDTKRQEFWMTTLDRRDVIRGFAAGSVALVTGQAGAAEGRRLTFVLTNDIYKMNAENGRGGLPKLAAVVKAERARSPDVIFAHGGDTLSPSLMSGFDQGEHMIELFNALPPDVFVPGNHEFDFGREIYLKRMGQARFPVLAANLREADGSVPAAHRDTLLIERAGLKIGIVGAALETTPVVSATSNMRFSPMIEAVTTAATALRAAGADLVVAVIHATRDSARDLLRSRAVDVILQGHNHDLHIEYDGRVSLTESGQDAEYVTCIDLDLDVRNEDGRRSIRWRPNYRVIDSKDVTPDPDMIARVKVYEAELSRELDVEVATLAVSLDSTTGKVRSAEMAIGNFIADAIRLQNGADVALINGGGIRGNRIYAAGQALTRRDILSELPFGNKSLVTVVTGAALKQALENGVSGQGSGRFPQISGMRITVDKSAPVVTRVLSVEINGAALDPERRYRVATNDFMARGGDGYTDLLDPRATDDSGDKLIANDVMAYARKRGTIDSRIEGRITFR